MSSQYFKGTRKKLIEGTYLQKAIALIGNSQIEGMASDWMVGNLRKWERGQIVSWKCSNTRVRQSEEGLR